MSRWIFLVLVLSSIVFLPLSGLANSPQYSPEMELLGGVLSQTSWIKNHGPAGFGNEYFRALQTFFAPYKNHEAVRIAEALTKSGFTYDAPPGFVCHLGPLPELELIYFWFLYGK